MAKTRITETARIERGGRDLRKQPHRFVGLFLAPLAGVLGSWLIHGWTLGVDIAWGQLSWRVDSVFWAPWIAFLLIAGVTGAATWLAGQFAKHREDSVRIALMTSVAVVGALFALNVGIGPNWWAAGLLVFGGWCVAVIWSIARLDVTRNDKRDGDSDEEDGLLKKLGISKATRFKPTVVHDADGEPSRIDVAVQHKPGETVKPLQDGIEHIESAAGGPPGMSTAIADPDHADRSTVTVMLKNPFKKNLPVGPLTAPGGSIAEWASVADYADGRPAFMTPAPGRHMPGATSLALIGATRAGKTGTETQLLTEWGSRIDWTCLYLNQAKGKQDIRPLLPIIEAAVIAADGDAGLATYRLAFQQVRAIMAYREDELSRHAISAWSPRCCDPNPDKRPTRLGADGKRHVMDRMPFLTCHVGEADAILADGRAAEDSVYLASKGLSLGVNTSWSLQRPDWKAMPTGLRSQIGMWLVHGLNGTDDEEYVVPETVRKSGARPGAWGARKPGQHIMFGPGIDEERFPVALKTRFLIGSDKDENGVPFDFDTLNDRYMAEMLRRNSESAPNMCKLDRGSAEATNGWWDEQARNTDELRERMLRPETATPVARNLAAPATPKRSPFAGVPQAEADEPDEPTATEMEESMTEFDEIAANTTEVEGINIYGDDPQEAAELRAADISAPAARKPMDADPLADSDEDDKPPARSKEEAREILIDTLVSMVDNPKYADRRRPGTAIVTPAAVFNECRVRSRPWTSAELTAIMLSGGGVKDGVVMERDGDPRKGGYRLSRTGGDDHSRSDFSV